MQTILAAHQELGRAKITVETDMEHAKRIALAYEALGNVIAPPTNQSKGDI